MPSEQSSAEAEQTYSCTVCGRPVLETRRARAGFTVESGDCLYAEQERGESGDEFIRRLRIIKHHDTE